ncbi:MAG: hypothetical protein CEO12_56 [Parcubacteria group bacterium Gr01-1014_46]|nr:MAG: hypothetical protein CEO12_56 [Parcubacteria group bacterium Gr01-1014_46]
MRHHTNNPAERAMHIAEREMEIAYREGRDGGNWARFWLDIYDQCLKEFAGQVPEMAIPRE